MLRRTLPDAQVRVAQTRTTKVRHGRVETRTLVVLHSADLNAYLGSAGTVGQPWPGVAQVLRQQRVARWMDRATGLPKVRSEVAYAITSLPPERATADDLLVRWRAHWHIENRLHWVRDVTLGEDASPIHVGQAPLVLALLRTAVLEVLRHAANDAGATLASTQRALTLHAASVPAFFAALAHRVAAAPRRARRPTTPLRLLAPTPDLPLRCAS